MRGTVDVLVILVEPVDRLCRWRNLAHKLKHKKAFPLKRSSRNVPLSTSSARGRAPTWVLLQAKRLIMRVSPATNINKSIFSSRDSQLVAYGSKKEFPGGTPNSKIKNIPLIETLVEKCATLDQLGKREARRQAFSKPTRCQKNI